MVSHVHLVLFIPLLICDFIDGYALNGLSLASDILNTSQQNAVLQSIWQQEPSNLCDVVKPPDSYLLNKESIQYNFSPFLCVILHDASLRYLEGTHPGESSIQKDIAQNIKTNSNKLSEKFCVSMRNNTWSTTIEENKQWTSSFTALMKDETECKRLCVFKEVNPLCAYVLWLDLQVKDAKKLPEIPKTPIHTKVGSVSSAGENSPSSLGNKQPSKGLVGQIFKVDQSSVGENAAHDTSMGSINLPLSPGALSVKNASQQSPNHLIEKSHLHTKNTGNSGQNDIAGKANVEPSAPIKTLPNQNSRDSQDTNKLNNDKLLQKQTITKPVNSLPSEIAVHNSAPIELTKEVSSERKDAHSVIPVKSKTASTAVSKEQTMTNDGSEDGRNTGEVSQVGQEGRAPPNQDAISEQRKPANHETLETPMKISAGVDQSAPLKDKAGAGGDSDIAGAATAGTVADAVPEGASEDKEGEVDVGDGEIDDHEDQKNEDLNVMGGEEEPQAPVAAMPPEEEAPDQQDAPRFDAPEAPAKPQDAPSKVNANDAETSDDDDDDDPLLEERGRTSQNGADPGFTHGRFVEAEDSHFFAYFMTMIILCVLGYLIFHNKQKILALALEGRVRKGVRRRPSTSGYRKLDSNLEEAITSSCTGSSATHVIY